MDYTNKIININCVDGMKNIPDDYIASCITDPPYNYEFIGHNWDNEEIKRRKENITLSPVRNKKNKISIYSRREIKSAFPPDCLPFQRQK